MKIYYSEMHEMSGRRGLPFVFGLNVTIAFPDDSNLQETEIILSPTSWGVAGSTDRTEKPRLTTSKGTPTMETMS